MSRLEKLVKEFAKVTKKSKIVITSPLPAGTQEKIDFLKSSNKNLDIVQWNSSSTIPRSELLSTVKGADGVYCLITDKVDKELVETAGPQLKVVSTMSVGYDHIDVKLLNEKRVLIGNTPGVLTEATAVITAMLVLNAARRAKEGYSAVVNGQWKDWSPMWLAGVEFGGKTLGMVGLGRIGTATAMRLIPFGFKKLLYTGRTRNEEKERVLTEMADSISRAQELLLGNKNNGNSDDVGFSTEYTDTIDKIMEEADVICICCALTESTRHLINAKSLAMINSNKSKDRRNVIIVNSARGAIINQKDLLDAMHAKDSQIFAAGLDVTDPEPLSMDDPLVKDTDNCFILPHLGSATIETRTAMSDLALENLLCGLSEQPLTAQVHK